MAFVQVQCPDCQSTDVVQYGKQANGTQRYRCDNPDCPRTIFLLEDVSEVLVCYSLRVYESPSNLQRIE